MKATKYSLFLEEIISAKYKENACHSIIEVQSTIDIIWSAGLNSNQCKFLIPASR